MPSASYFRTIFQTPALRALAYQGLAFLLILVGATAWESATGGAAALAIRCVWQGGLAAGLSYWGGLAPWWLVMQAVFPGALALTLSAHLPPILFLVAFLVFLALFWTTFRTQVPYFPSTHATWEAVTRLLPQDRHIRFVDIGSGFGGLVLHLAASRPESHFGGVELAPLPWLISCLRARAFRRNSRSSVGFARCDYLKVHFGAYDVVFAFLSPAAMPMLWRKARAEMRSGSLLLSYEFPIPGAAPDFALPPDHRGAILYGWRMPPLRTRVA